MQLGWVWEDIIQHKTIKQSEEQRLEAESSSPRHDHIIVNQKET